MSKEEVKKIRFELARTCPWIKLTQEEEKERLGK